MNRRDRNDVRQPEKTPMRHNGHRADEANGRSNEQTETSAGDGMSGGTPSRRGFLKTTAGVGVVAGTTALGIPAVSGQALADETCTSGETYTVGDGNFEVINNQWGNSSATQCIQRYEDGRYGWTFEGGSGDINYPEVYVGTRPWGSDTGVPEFPVARGDVDELTMEWDFDIDVQAGQEWNLAEEWWLLDGQPTSQNPPLTHEIMLVCDWSPQHSHGGVRESAVRTDQYGNQLDYWAFYNQGGTNADFHIFRIGGGASSGRVDLTEIIDFLDERHGLRQDLTMTGIELGTETFNGPTGDVLVNNFDVTVNGATYTSGLEDGVGAGTGSGTGGESTSGTGGDSGSGTGGDSGSGGLWGSGGGDSGSGGLWGSGGGDSGSGGLWGSGGGDSGGDSGSGDSGSWWGSGGSDSDSGSGGWW